MVSYARAWTGGCVLRQWLIRRGCGCAFFNFAGVLSLGMARRVCHSGPARFFVADRLAPAVSPSSGASAHQRCRAKHDSHRNLGGTNRGKTAPAMARPFEAATNVGNDHLQGLTDPVWFFVTDWFPIYLVAKGISLKSGLLAVWVPFLAADLGNFFGGGVSGYLIRRGWSLGAARKALVVFGGVGVLLLIPTIFTVNLYLITMLFGLATFSYASFSTIANVLPTDLYTSDSVATVSGLSGTGAGIGTIIAFELIGHFSDTRQASGTHTFDPIVIVAGLIPFLGMILVLLLVRNTRATDQGLVRRI